MHETKILRQHEELHAVPLVTFPSITLRAGHLARTFLSWLYLYVPGVLEVSIEDYAFAATGRVFHIGENTGILKHILDENGIVFNPVPPTVIKKFATGKGNSDKIKMTQAFLEAYPAAREWAPKFFPRSPDGHLEPSKWAKSPLADLADAYWIARYANKNN